MQRIPRRKKWFICVLTHNDRPVFKIVGWKKIPATSLNQWINLDIKTVLVGDEGQPIEFI